MKEHPKKIIAPIIVVICIALYYFIGVNVLIKINIPKIVKMIALILSLIITIAFIMVLIERIKEIKQGEEDDLSKY
jgi:ABC-type multidrug transport system permease subunit